MKVKIKNVWTGYEMIPQIVYCRLSSNNLFHKGYVKRFVQNRLRKDKLNMEYFLLSSVYRLMIKSMVDVERLRGSLPVKFSLRYNWEAAFCRQLTRGSADVMAVCDSWISRTNHDLVSLTQADSKYGQLTLASMSSAGHHNYRWASSVYFDCAAVVDED